MTEVIASLQAIEWQEVDILPVVRENPFNHVHWRKKANFDPEEGYQKWLNAKGYPPNEQDELRRLEEYFASFGVNVNLLNCSPRGKYTRTKNPFNLAINYQEFADYDPEGLVELFGEIDFGLNIVTNSINRWTVANCTKVFGSRFVVEDFSLYLPQAPFQHNLKELANLVQQGLINFEFNPSGQKLFSDLLTNRTKQPIS